MASFSIATFFGCLRFQSPFEVRFFRALASARSWQGVMKITGN
jgi:hypothetical protein